MLSALLVGAGSIAVGLLFVFDYEAPCRRTGPVADLDLSYHMPQPYAAASVLMNLAAPTLLVLPVALLWRGRRGTAVAIVAWFVVGFAIWYVTDPIVWHNRCGAS